MAPTGKWHVAATLSALVGGSDARYPAGTPAIVELDFPEDELMAKLKLPRAEWWPLAETLRTQRQFLNIRLPAGSRVAAGVARLASEFAAARFLIDPFRHGPTSAWQAQARLAERENVWLSTLGLRDAALWPRAEDVADAFYFMMGEVGASKVLYASGRTLPECSDAESWLSAVPCVDAAQRALILTLNAQELFG